MKTVTKMGNRKRIKPKKLRKGDVVRAIDAGVKWEHIYFILEDQTEGNHVQCFSVCNLTGSKIPKGEHAFELSEYDLPEVWFKTKKPQTWLRCKDIECIRKLQIIEELGNIIESHPKLWSDICRAFHSCRISEKFKNACDCEYEIIQREINLELYKEEDCECET
ncbi:hypothetical protein [Flavobacterium gawalongense]|uniref:Uncharacterized protein n=1 Tax=Flavobacterium gawalongense TaxID=2594432 RepID=A0ABY3CFL2_9FLAO|nr:hypothetical protein [Flavobacterium gawalongense]TRW97176.1 hypothetical protein FNW33_16580 [Flavobacterium gawalongense]TRX02131.1 hypothetical protein FNW12_16485 [Flavobacterium gawalongense]